MMAFLAVTVGLLVQAAGHPVLARAARAPDPVRVWRTDSIAYVALRDPGHLVLLNVDPLGRITDGRRYDYGGVKSSRDGSVAALGLPVQPDVCLSCVRRGTSVAAAPAPMPTNAVDCSNASMTNSFCGVNSGSVSITSAPQAAYQPPPAAAPAAVYVPYYLPMFVLGARAGFARPIIPPTPSAPQ